MLTIKATIKDSTTEALKAISPENMPGLVRRALDKAGELIVGKIREDRMSQRAAFGDKSPSTLGVVTGMGRRSVRATSARIEGTGAVIEIGSQVGYIQGHEFGFNGTVNVKQHFRRGYQIKKVSSRNSFSGKATGYKTRDISGGSVRAHTRKVNLPERRMIRGGAEDNLKLIDTAIVDEIRAAMK